MHENTVRKNDLRSSIYLNMEQSFHLQYTTSILHSCPIAPLRCLTKMCGSLFTQMLWQKEEGWPLQSLVVSDASALGSQNDNGLT